MLIDRRGAIEHVIVGDASKIMLPDVGRIRGGAGRFRGLRLVHTHLRGEALTRDDLTDLALLRLDAVAAITVDAAGRPGKLFVGHLVADGPPIRARSCRPSRRPRRSSNFVELIARLEARVRPRAPRASTRRGKDRALLVHVAARPRRATPRRAIAELRELCRTAGVKVLDVLVQRRPEADPKFLVGRGKLDEILAARDAARRRGADLRSRSVARARRARSARRPSSRSSIARC